MSTPFAPSEVEGRGVAIFGPRLRSDRAESPAARLLLGSLLLALAACGGPTEPGSTTGGATTSSHAGNSSSSGGGKEPVDAGARDGGTEPADAGLADGGTQPADAGLADGGTPPADAGLADGGTQPTDAGLADGGSPPSTGPWAPILVAATQGMLTQGYDVQISGAGMDGGAGTLQISGNTGTLQLFGVTYPVVSYEQIPFSAADETLYQLLGVSADKLIVAWAYCNGGLLNEIWYETSDGVPVTYESASGTCTVTPSSETSAVTFPAADLTALPLVQGYSVEAPDLAFDGSDAGVMELNSEWFWIYPFNTVDCSTNCGSPGWYELHSLLWDAVTDEACFGIYYLFVETPHETTVPLDYVICLPGLNDPTNGGTAFAAIYTYPDAAP